MQASLPHFRYHPNPIHTGAVETSAVACECCGIARGYTYVGPVYATQDLDGKLCPWCIANGSVAAKFGASFGNCYPLERAGVSRDVQDEIDHRTPGYISWQQETWVAHCGDACEFHGDIATNDLRSVNERARRQLQAEAHYSDPEWEDLLQHYKPGGEVAIYKFICRHCGQVVLGMDRS